MFLSQCTQVQVQQLQSAKNSQFQIFDMIHSYTTWRIVIAEYKVHSVFHKRKHAYLEMLVSL